MSWLKRLGGGGALLLFTLLLGGCAFTGPQSIFDTAGPIAERQLGLFMYTFWLSLLVLAFVGAFLISALVKFRAKSPDDKRVPEQVHGNLKVEVLWTVIPVFIVLLIAVPTVRTIFATEVRVTPSEEDLIVNVVGWQWWWVFEYPQYGFVTANELHVPVDRRVILNLDSGDVLHAFWVPRVAGKRDLIPGQDNQLWFSVSEPGLYYGQCAELCLGAHAYMRFRLIASPEDEFQSWVSAFQEADARQVSGDARVAQGAQLYRQKGCAGCHGLAGVAPEGVGPNLTNFGMRTSLGAGILPNTAENLAAWLRDPQALKPGNYMPTLWDEADPNREAEIDALVAFLLSLGADEAEMAMASLGGRDGDR